MHHVAASSHCAIGAMEPIGAAIGEAQRAMLLASYGSTVYWELDRKPDQIGISGGSFFDLNFPTLISLGVSAVQTELDLDPRHLAFRPDSTSAPAPE